jgi:hypothetical protein
MPREQEGPGHAPAVDEGSCPPGHFHPLPAEPTAAVPGSEEKLGVLAERASREEQLFHPEDRRAG